MTAQAPKRECVCKRRADGFSFTVQLLWRMFIDHKNNRPKKKKKLVYCVRTDKSPVRSWDTAALGPAWVQTP